MIYYPKSKILENQYTNGNEFVLKRTNAPYQGYYYALSNNTFYTGRNSENPQTEEIIYVKKENSNYKGPETNTGFVVPVPYYPVPTEVDYKLGFITRYFMKRRNSSYITIIEISPDDYQKYFSNVIDDLDTNIYVAVKINWKITGPLNNDFSDKNFPKTGVIETNKKLVQLKEKLFPGISLFITDYEQFRK